MTLKLLKKKNYLSMIENSANGENWMFKNLWAERGSEVIDILNNGQLSCAVFVSSVLYLHKIIGDIHANVSATVKDMMESGWHEIEDLRPGAVLVWEKKDFGVGGIHGHVGFYMGHEQAISNSSLDKGIPTKHHFTYNGSRRVEKILWHSELDGE